MIDFEGEDTDPDPPAMIGSHESDGNGRVDWLVVAAIALVIIGVVCFLLGLVVG